MWARYEEKVAVASMSNIQMVITATRKATLLGAATA